MESNKTAQKPVPPILPICFPHGNWGTRDAAKGQGFENFLKTVFISNAQSPTNHPVTHKWKILRSGFFPSNWKLSKLTMIPKPGKDPTQVSSFRPISLLPIIRKAFLPYIIQKNITPNQQFGFREGHNSIEQVPRIIHEIKNSFERKQYCSAVFLVITLTIDKV